MKTKLCVLLSVFVICISLVTIYFVNKSTLISEPDSNLLAFASVNSNTFPAAEAVLVEEPIVYDGLTKSELIDKINRSLHSTLENKGELYVSYSLELGLDPYLAVAITLHETGCKWDCSRLVKQCNNVGGQKGTPSCAGGAYRSYPTLDEGIKGYLNNLYKNYVQLGLTTPEQIGPKYAASKTWSTKINKYIEEIKAK